MSNLLLKLSQMRVDDLRPHATNPKTHTAGQTVQIAASIERFGFNDPIGVLPDGTIVEGEGRWLAAKHAGITSVPVIILENMTERDADLYRIAHNKIALSTGFDVERLMEALSELTGAGISLQTMGFENDASLTGINQATPAPIVSVTDEVEVANLDYVIIWDNAEQKSAFDQFVQSIRQAGETAADAVLRAITELSQTNEGAEYVVTHN